VLAVPDAVEEVGVERGAAVEVTAWCTKLGEQGYAVSTVYALHSRMARVMSDAVHDGILARSPCSRRTSPPRAKQRPCVATTGRASRRAAPTPEELRPAILLAAFAGLRVAETCCLRVSDVDFLRAVITPTVQYPAEPLKTETTTTPIPISRTLANLLAAHVGRVPSEHVLTGEAGESGWQLGSWVGARACVPGR
jgi:integrase